MVLFFFWIGLVVLAVFSYMLVLWIKHRHRARLRVQLTFLFFLFAMIPVVPLTFLSAEFFTRTADMLLLPGIGEAMDVSLQALKSQAEARGLQFLEHVEPEKWNRANLAEQGIAGCGVWIVKDDSLQTVFIEQIENEPLNKPSMDMIRDVIHGRRFSEFASVDSQQVMMVYRLYDDSKIGMVCYRLPEQLVQAKDNMEQAISIYQTLGLLKHSVIEKNLIWSVGVIFVLILAGLSVFAAGKLSRSIHEPVDVLVNRMQDVATGQLDRPIDIDAKGEFRFLVDSFNRMIDDLNASQKKLIQAERLAAWQDVARKVSHEIKNSLTPVSISLRRLQNHLESVQNRSAVEESLEAIADEMGHLQNLASHFSELAKMPPAEKQPLQINDILKSTLAILEPSKGSLKFQSVFTPNLPMIQGDRNQIRQVMHNLVQNAMDASSERGTILIQTSLNQQSDHIRIEVCDEGAGVPDDQISKLFQPYYTTKTKGTGLGLAIVQKIVQDHDGTVTAENRKNKGMCFSVVLPI